jgi:hypothetical protein
MRKPFLEPEDFTTLPQLLSSLFRSVLFQVMRNMIHLQLASKYIFQIKFKFYKQSFYLFQIHEQIENQLPTNYYEKNYIKYPKLLKTKNPIDLTPNHFQVIWQYTT